MNRFFITWVGLGAIATVVTYAVTLAVFRHVDLSFTQFAILLVAPAAQAAMLTWPSGAGSRVTAALGRARRDPFARSLLVLDVILLVAGVAWWSSSVAGFGAPVTVQTTWIAGKALAAAVWCLVAVPRRFLSARAGVIVVLLLIATQALGGGLEQIFAEIDHRTAVVPEVFLRAGFYGVLYATGVAWLLRAGRLMRGDAQVWITVAVALSVPGVLLVLLSMFIHPAVLPPWRGLALVWASAGVSALVLAVLTHSAGESRA